MKNRTKYVFWHNLSSFRPTLSTEFLGGGCKFCLETISEQINHANRKTRRKKQTNSREGKSFYSGLKKRTKKKQSELIRIERQLVPNRASSIRDSVVVLSLNFVIIDSASELLGVSVFRLLYSVLDLFAVCFIAILC